MYGCKRCSECKVNVACLVHHFPALYPIAPRHVVCQQPKAKSPKPTPLSTFQRAGNMNCFHFIATEDFGIRKILVEAPSIKKNWFVCRKIKYSAISCGEPQGKYFNYCFKEMKISDCFLYCIFRSEILIFLWARSPCKILEPYDNPLWSLVK